MSKNIILVGEIISSVCIAHRRDYQFCVHHTQVRLSVLSASHTGEIISSVCIAHRWDYQFCVHHTQVRLSVLCASHTGEIISSVCITHRGDYQFCVHHTRVRLSVLCASHTGEIISSVCIAHRWDYQFTCIIHRWDYQFCVLSHSKVPTCSVPVALLKQWRRIMAVNYINWQCSMILKWFITYEYITLNPSIMMMTTTTTIDTDRQALNVTINTVSTLCPLISQFHLPNKNCKINDTSHSQFCL